MPYVHLDAPGDFTSIYYTANTPLGNVGAFDPKKEVVIMLHPAFLDSSWLYNQFTDVRLNEEFNLIAFDMRTCGRSISKPSEYHDSWVEAADLARVMQVCPLCCCAPPGSHLRIFSL